MSWLIKTDIELTEKQVEDVLKNLGVLGICSKQSWGWSCECDVSLDNEKVNFSGAEFSRNCSLPYRFINEIGSGKIIYQSR